MFSQKPQPAAKKPILPPLGMALPVSSMALRGGEVLPGEALSKAKAAEPQRARLRASGGVPRAAESDGGNPRLFGGHGKTRALVFVGS